MRGIVGRAARSSAVALAWLALAGPAALVAQAAAPEAPGPGWPTCDGRQVEVVLVGTLHFSEHADDILSASRQAEITEVVRSLAKLEPSEVALEAGIESQAELNAAYGAYLAGEHDLTANERQQIGFRLARSLGHDSVYAVDSPRSIGNDSIGAFYERHPRIQQRYAWVLQGVERRRAEAAERYRSSTIGEYLRWLNSEDALETEANSVMYGHVMAGEGSNYGGPRMLEAWYGRNLRIVHHVARLADRDDDRILLLIGSGHVRPLRHLLRLAPQYCPVSPLPYLPPDTSSG